MEQEIPASLQKPQDPATAAAAIDPLPPEGFEARVLSLVRAGRKIEAIKLFREQTGRGLKEAKDAVEAFAADPNFVLAIPASESVDVDAFEAQILALLRAQKKIEAIKLFRSKTACGLKEAKDAVEALAAKHGISPGAGCAGMVILVVFVSAVIGFGACIVGR